MNMFSIDEMEILEEELPIYGDFLKFYKIDLDLLPISKGTPLFKVGSLYSRLEDMHRGMLAAYIMLALLKSGSGYVDLDPEVFEDGNRVGEERNFEYERESLENYIRDNIKGGIDYLIIDSGIFVNSKNPKEAMNVISICALDPWFSQVHNYTADDLIKKLNKNKEPILKDCPSIEHITDVIIIDPLLFKTCKEEINSIKQEIEDKIGKDIVKHPSEFLSSLAIDQPDFDVEWSRLHAEAMAYLKAEYEFLVLYEEKEAIDEAQGDLKTAVRELEEEKYRDAVGKAGRACEGMLRVLYHIYKKKTVGEKSSFDNMLNELRDEIFDDFGEDIFSDLHYIREWRNAAVHPKSRKIKPEVAVKVIRKAQLFQELFFNKMKGSL